MDNYNDNYQLSSTKAIQEISKLKFSLTKKDIEMLIKRFQIDRWIVEREGKYSLDIRSIAELSEYIKKNVLDDDDLIECPICLDYIFSDMETCSNPDCNYHIHSSCAALKFSNRTSSTKICPRCKEPWNKEFDSIIADDIIEDIND